jgi:hypothetical protein
MKDCILEKPNITGKLLSRLTRKSVSEDLNN